MTTNLERSEAIIAEGDELAVLDCVSRSSCEWLKDAIEAALDEAEKRGADIWSCAACGNLYTSKSQWLDHAAWHAQRDDTINAILDKVIAMNRCNGGCERYDSSYLVAGEPCPDCDGTGLGPIARMVKEARDAE